MTEISRLDIRTDNTKGVGYIWLQNTQGQRSTRSGSYKEDGTRRMAPAETMGHRARLGGLSKMGKVEEHCRTSRPTNQVGRNHARQCNHVHCEAGVMDIG